MANQKKTKVISESSNTLSQDAQPQAMPDMQTQAMPDMQTQEALTPVVATPVVKAKAVKNKLASKPVSEIVQPKSEQVVEAASEPTVLEGGAKKVKKSRKVKQETEQQAESDVVLVVKKTKKAKKSTDEQNEECPEGDDDCKTRSFKVQLPGLEDFTGRFTGLTPYQAANKALSKYFRNKENLNLSENNVVFSIKESTRGSKRNTYTYKGNRVKLDVPITYVIKSVSGEERVITKQYKNQLIKLKKNVAVENVAIA